MLNPLLNSDNPLTAALCCNRLPVCLSVCVCLEKCGNRLDLFQHHEGGAHDWAPSTHPHMMTHFFFLNMNFKLFFPTRTESKSRQVTIKVAARFEALSLSLCLVLLRADYFLMTAPKHETPSWDRVDYVSVMSIFLLNVHVRWKFPLYLFLVTWSCGVISWLSATPPSHDVCRLEVWRGESLYGGLILPEIKNK